MPDTVLLLGPRHTGRGASYAIAAHDAWEIPGAEIPVAKEFVELIINNCPLLTADTQAHQQEHCLEVLLPYLWFKNPALRILPIVFGPCGYAETTQLAAGLAQALKQISPRPLIVVSSDMNHFADEQENRRRDELALAALLRGSPLELYNTCETNEISMCGMLPAVTALQILEQLMLAPALELVSYGNSAKASGDTSRVVGYAGLRIREAK